MAEYNLIEQPKAINDTREGDTLIQRGTDGKPKRQVVIAVTEDGYVRFTTTRDVPE